MDYIYVHPKADE